MYKYNMKIENGISFKRNAILRKIFNRITVSSNMNFNIINFLALFWLNNYRKVVYFGDKDSIIFERYRKDKNSNKVFVSNAKGLKYKFLILNCKRLITNKKYKEVLPFGLVIPKYVQASHFIIERVGW